MALEDDDPDCSQSSVPLMSRRRVSLSSSSENVGDIEQGSVCPKSSLESSDSGAPGDSINVRVKTAGDGREYKVSSVLTATVAQVRKEVATRWRSLVSHLVLALSVVHVVNGLLKLITHQRRN